MKEARRAAHTLRVDFEKGGIHLCAGKFPIMIGISDDMVYMSSSDP